MDSDGVSVRALMALSAKASLLHETEFVQHVTSNWIKNKISPAENAFYRLLYLLESMHNRAGLLQKKSDILVLRRLLFRG